MTVRDGFAVFILTHGRPEFLEKWTVHTLNFRGYTGPWFVVLDDEDPTREEYARRFGADRIRLFHKDDADTDMGDNGGPRGVSVYARNAVNGIAESMGLTWTLTLDDDYQYFGHRFVDGEQLRGCKTHRLDEVMEFYLDFLEDTGALTVAFAQGGDFMGGAGSPFLTTRIRRKAMNSFFTRVDRPIRWVGRLNEDVNTYIEQGATGGLFLTACDFMLDQLSTQQSPGGISDAYAETGTYVKSFHTVMRAPSAVKITTLGRIYDRIHHIAAPNLAVPKIISELYRKVPA